VSDLGKRVIVAVVAIPCILFLAFTGGYAWFVFLAVLVVIALLEYARLVRTKGARPQTGLMILVSLLLLLTFMHQRLAADALVVFGAVPWPLQWQAILWVLLLFMIVLLLVELYRGAPSPLLNVASTSFGVLYIGLFVSCTLGIREIFNVMEFPVGRVFGTATLDPVQLEQLSRWGGWTVIALLVSIWLCDTAAYFGGRSMGKHKLFPRVSPNKTVEGAIWGGVTAIGSMLAAKYLVLDYLSVTNAIVIGAMVGVIGQLGDLVESLLKRDAGVKDSSSLLPGHGGVLDRFDSLIFVSPAVFLYLDFVVFA